MNKLHVYLYFKEAPIWKQDASNDLHVDHNEDSIYQLKKFKTPTLLNLKMLEQ